MKVKGKKKHFVNGYYSNEDWIRLVTDKEKFDTFKRKFSTAKGKDKCPPLDLTEAGMCYRCFDCANSCAEYVKEYKKHYMVKNQKYMKIDIEKGDD